MAPPGYFSKARSPPLVLVTQVGESVVGHHRLVAGDHLGGVTRGAPPVLDGDGVVGLELRSVLHQPHAGERLALAALRVIGADERFPVDAGDDVAAPDPGLGGGAPRRHRPDGRADRVVFDGPRVHPDAQPCPALGDDANPVAGRLGTVAGPDVHPAGTRPGGRLLRGEGHGKTRRGETGQQDQSNRHGITPPRGQNPTDRARVTCTSTRAFSSPIRSRQRRSASCCRTRWSMRSTSWSWWSTCASLSSMDWATPAVRPWVPRCSGL